MYDSRRLRGWNRFAGGSLVAFASILVRLQRNGRLVIMFWRLSTNFTLCMILAGCAGGTALPMLSSDVCVDFASPPSKTGGWWLCFGVFQQIYVVYDSRRLRGWNWFAGGSGVTFALILVRLQAKRDVDNYVLASFNKFMLCMILAGCAGGTGLPAAL